MRDALPEARGRARLRAIGIGNRWRRDDAAGLAVAARLRDGGVEAVEHDGDPVGLLDRLARVDAAWIVDAVSSGVPPGTVHRLDAAASPLPTELFRTTTHRLGLDDALELGRALGRLPPRTIVYGIEGARFDAGEGLTPEVAAAVERVARAVLLEIRQAPFGAAPRR